MESKNQNYYIIGVMLGYKIDRFPLKGVVWKVLEVRLKPLRCDFRLGGGFALAFF